MKKYISCLLALVLVLGLLTGCGGANESVAFKSETNYDYAMEAAAEAPMAMESGLSTGSGAEMREAAVPENRKWIVTVYLSAETEDLDTLTANLDAQIASFGGYVENQSVYNGSFYETYRRRNASLTIRIPADKVDGFVESVGEVSNVTSQEKNREDITLTYVATESRMKALQTEETRLLELLAQAETMEDLLTIEERLTDVRYELESVTSQMRLYDNQVDFATIHLNISEVKEYTPVEEPTFWEKITEGFADSIKGVGQGIVDFIAWVIIASPYLVIYGILLVVVIFLARRIRRSCKARKEARKAKKEAKKQTDA